MTKKQSSPVAKPKSRVVTPPPKAAKKAALVIRSLDDDSGEPLLDASGTFRVTTQIANAQRGLDENTAKQFPDQSLAMAAQTAGFADDAPTADDASDEAVDDDVLRAERRQRLVTLAARAQTRPRTR